LIPECHKHALIECWKAAKEILNIKLPNLHPDTWTRDIICESVISADDTKIITIMRSIWDSCNRLTHGENGDNPTTSMEFVRDTLLSLEMPPVHKVAPSSRPKYQWRKPPEGVVKINSDGALSAQERVVGGGGITREDFRGAWCNSYPGVTADD
jgi:hypothetical protein